jgi:hypothetical protein
MYVCLTPLVSFDPSAKTIDVHRSYSLFNFIRLKLIVLGKKSNFLLHFMLLVTRFHLPVHSCILQLITDKKENKVFLMYKEIQMGAVAKSYMRKGFLNPNT